MRIKDSYYRLDVDGLRAIAIAGVYACHANFTWARGGYMGVDVFFVISGYLIGDQIITSFLNGKFSLFDF